MYSFYTSNYQGSTMSSFSRSMLLLLRNVWKTSKSIYGYASLQRPLPSQVWNKLSSFGILTRQRGLRGGAHSKHQCVNRRISIIGSKWPRKTYNFGTTSKLCQLIYILNILCHLLCCPMLCLWFRIWTKRDPFSTQQDLKLVSLLKHG